MAHDSRMSCLRCAGPLEGLESTSFIQRRGLVDSLTPPAGLPDSEKFDIYSCTRCGHVEFFLEDVGRSLRGKKAVASVSRVAGRVVGKLMPRRRNSR